mmetsp:Transcript_10390/g.25811  ORF Transcript_10390/g.25811 Transcript_10390/m.25811 type:complete len:272 (+) Transcript_10390:369-1184(+)
MARSSIVPLAQAAPSDERGSVAPPLASRHVIAALANRVDDCCGPHGAHGHVASEGGLLHPRKLQQHAQVRHADEAADDAPQHARPQPLHQQRCDGCGAQPPRQKREHQVRPDAIAADMRPQREEESQHGGDRHEELARADGADHDGGGQLGLREEASRRDWPPPAAASRVDESADQPDGEEPPPPGGRRVGGTRGVGALELEEDDQSEREEERACHRPCGGGGEGGEERRASQRAEDARQREARDGGAVDVAQVQVGEAGGGGGAELREVD